MSPEINPYAAPQSEPAKIPEVQPHGPGWRLCMACAVILLAGAPVAAGIAWIDIESIVVSGAASFLLAIALAALVLRNRLGGMLVISLAFVAMAIGCFLTIFLNSWTPQKAYIPIGIAVSVFAGLIQLGWLIVRRYWSNRRSAVE